MQGQGPSLQGPGQGQGLDSVTGHWSEGALVRNLTLTLTNPNLTLTLTLRLYNFRTSDPSDQ